MKITISSTVERLADEIRRIQATGDTVISVRRDRYKPARYLIELQEETTGTVAGQK